MADELGGILVSSFDALVYNALRDLQHYGYLLGHGGVGPYYLGELRKALFVQNHATKFCKITS